MNLELAPRVAKVFPKLLQSGPYRQILSNSVDTGDRLDRRQIANLISKLNFYKLIPYPMDNC